MSKSQILIIIVALAAVVGLFFLPKSVVNNKNKEVSENQTSKTDSSTTAPTSNAETMHQTSLSPKEIERLNYWKKQFEQKGEKEKNLAFDSLAELYRKANFYDSVAYYADNLAISFPKTLNLMKAGDAYYEAFGFAMNPEKSKTLGEKARTYFKKVVEAEPSLSDAKVKLGMTYVNSETPMQGIMMIREVLQKEPDNQFAIMSLGKLSMQSGQYDKAAERFRQLLKLNDKDILAHFYLGVSLLQLGKNQEALKELKHVKNNSSDPAILQSVESYLKDIQ
jgi:predicted Zn-dependent protease